MEEAKLIIWIMLCGGFTLTLTTTLILYFREKVWLDAHINKLVSLYEESERTVVYGKKYFGSPLIMGVLSGVLLWAPVVSSYWFVSDPGRFWLIITTNLVGIIVVSLVLISILLGWLNHFVSFILITNKHVYIRGISCFRYLISRPMSKYEIDYVKRILVSNLYGASVMVISFKDGKKFKFRTIINRLEIVRALDPRKEKSIGSLGGL